MKHTFRVWAPLPSRIRLQHGNKQSAMTKTQDGWWQTQVELTGGATDYGFILDGEGPFPDPRSPWQPAGVHGLSRLVDHSTFQWTDGGWQAPPLAAAVIYELHTGTFTPEGTFDAAIGKLDHLVKLGVTHVELMPVNQFCGNRGWGYDGVDLFAPHHGYGGPEGLKRFVNACHARRLAVLLDVVYNHLGPVGNYLARFAPYFTKRYSAPWGKGPNFDGPESQEVRRFFCDNAAAWLRDYHFDGLRLDAVHAIFDTSAEHFLEQLGVEIKQLQAALGRHLVLIAESDLNDPRLLWSRERGGFALDAQWCDDFHHALHVILTGERNGYYADFGEISDLAKVLREGYVYDGCYSKHRRRPHGRKASGLGGDRFVVCLQNHDQVGNRAMGDRISALVNLAALKIGSGLLLTSPFVPLLFQGEEWGASTPFLYFTDYDEPKLARAVRQGRCDEFAMFEWKAEEVPDPQSLRTFRSSRLDWGELGVGTHAKLFEWYRALLRLRRAHPELTDGDLARVRVDFDEAGRWLVMERGTITVACNLSSRRAVVRLRGGGHRCLLASGGGVRVGRGGASLPAASLAVFKT